ncbi:MAG: hypothetical protein ACI9OJ_001314 [Myxococcota bacterium]|jgi:hypothetical protein
MALHACSRSLGRVGLVLALFLASSASAHLIPAGKGTLNLVGPKAYVVLSLPVAAFTIEGVSAARLSPAELAKNQVSLQEQVAAGIAVSAPGELGAFDKVLVNLPTGSDHTSDAGQELVALIVVRFSAPPKSVSLTSRLWADGAEGSGGLKVKATESRGATTVRAEIGVLSSDRPAFLFFASTSEVFRTSFELSLRHLAVGLDHLLFLFLLLIVQVDLMRSIRLAGLLTASFAAAFGISMAISSPLPLPWIEVGIAVTVAAAGLRLGLWRGKAPVGWASDLGWTMGLGVIHGLGFVSVVVQPGFADHLPWTKLLGSAVAVAAGLLISALSVWAVIAVARRFTAAGLKRNPRVAFAIVAVTVGLYWTAERLQVAYQAV